MVFVGGDGDRLMAATGREFVADTWPGEGPLGGVVDALRWFRPRDADGVVIAACDLPNLTERSRSGRRRRRRCGGRHRRAHCTRHLAWWPISAADQLEALFTSGVRSLHEALGTLGATRVRVDEFDLRNVNRPGDLGD